MEDHNKKDPSPSSPVHILYLTDTGDIIGGGEFSLLGILENINRDKFLPFVVMPHEGNLTKKIRELNVSVFILPLVKIKNPFHIQVSFRSFKYLLALMKNIQVNLVHSNSCGGIAILGGLAAKILKVPFVWHLRTFDAGGFVGYIQGFLATRIIVISKALENTSFCRAHRDKNIVIYNGIDLARFGNSPDRERFRNELGCQEGELLVGNIGRYNRIKGYEYLIRAAKIVTEELLCVKFVIVGFGFRNAIPYVSRLQCLISRLDLEGRVILKEEREDIPGVLSAMDVFVFSSPKEPFGRVLVEAMASSRPTVAFRGGGAPEIIEDGQTGFLVPARNARTMAQKIIQLLKDKGLREKFGSLGKARAKELFDIRSNCRNIEKLYLEIFNQRLDYRNVKCNLCGQDDYRVFKRQGLLGLVKCRHCGLFYVNPQPYQDLIEKIYDENYYAPSIPKAVSVRDKTRMQRLEKIGAFQKKGRLLDVGCGCGFFLEKASRNGWEVYGVDISEYAIRYAEEEIGIKLFKGGLKEASFPDGFFDCVTFWHVLEHLTDPLSALVEVRRILKPDGVLVIAVPNIRNYIYRIAYMLFKGRAPEVFSKEISRIHLFYFSPKTLKKMLEKAGFQTVKFDFDIERLFLPEIILDFFALLFYKIFRVNLGIAFEVYAKKG